MSKNPQHALRLAITSASCGLQDDDQHVAKDLVVYLLISLGLLLKCAQALMAEDSCLLSDHLAYQ